MKSSELSAAMGIGGLRKRKIFQGMLHSGRILAMGRSYALWNVKAFAIAANAALVPAIKTLLLIPWRYYSQVTDVRMN
jgi:hypothetical protein